MLVAWWLCATSTRLTGDDLLQLLRSLICTRVGFVLLNPFIVLGRDMIRLADNVKAVVILVHIFHEGRQQLTFVAENGEDAFTIVVVQAYLAAQQRLEVQPLSTRQDLDSALEVNLILVEAAFLACVH